MAYAWAGHQPPVAAVAKMAYDAKLTPSALNVFLVNT